MMMTPDLSFLPVPKMNEEYFNEIKAIIMTCVKEAVAGEISDEDNADSGAEMILRCGYVKHSDCTQALLQAIAEGKVVIVDKQNWYQDKHDEALRKERKK